MNATDLELTILEDLLNDECKCEARYHDTYECSKTVVARMSYRCSPRSPLVCQSVVTEYWESCEAGDWDTTCGHLVSECWSIRPV